MTAAQIIEAITAVTALLTAVAALLHSLGTANILRKHIARHKAAAAKRQSPPGS